MAHNKSPFYMLSASCKWECQINDFCVFRNLMEELSNLLTFWEQLIGSLDGSDKFQCLLQFVKK